ncbi:Plastocyanin-like protein [Corchorus capsularis]|uniref:Plastocyanin-like protein n=1 Tax=Corchorus capsularis TaxID=210143 RepID=A0A1R3HVZ2_COCAP|nr:Plastocyanin-like protein [Corchorus capsularis]
MEDKKISRYGSIFPIIIIVICLSFLKVAKSEVYTVGDQDEWNSETDYASWSQKYNFSLGDVLEFKYSKGQHNALEVTEATYRSCDTSSGVIAKYESGDDRVELNESKKYWFVCDVDGHCLGGMRFGIDVKAVNTSITNLGPTPSPPANSANNYAFERWSLSLYLFASGILLNMFW